MRVAVVMALVLLCGCASEKLALTPPAGVNFSGHWRLNVEESDDPLHLIQSQIVDPSKTTPGSGPGGGQVAVAVGTAATVARSWWDPVSGPTAPAVGALSDGLRWPGREVEIKQVAGVVAITSAGINQVYQPTTGDGKRPIHLRPSDDAAAGREREMPARDRGPPPICGWDEKTLVVQSGESDDDHPPFEKRYSVSENGQRLIEIVGFKGGRSGGFTMSRVWDRVDPDAPPPPAMARPAMPEGIRPDSK